MKLIFLSFLFLFVLPMAVMVGVLPQQTRLDVAETVAVAAALFVAALMLPRVLRRVFQRRSKMPSRRRLASLDWPVSLSRGEMEACCVAWLRGRGWSVTLVTDTAHEAEEVYVLAKLGASTVVLLCDRYGEELNPAAIRAFAAAGATLGATRPVLLTLTRGKLPHPAEAAAERAGVLLLRVADLARLDDLAPAEPAAA
jgi:hypothetical protein